MLNLKDIKKLHSDHPFPKEVSEIREKILDAFKTLSFDPGPHKYMVTDEQIELPSVSSIASRFAPKEDWDEITRKYALKHNMEVDVVKRMWKENNIRSTNNGTSTHLFLESYMWFFLDQIDKIDPVILPQFEEGYLIPYGAKQEAGMKYFMSLYNTYYDNSVPVKLYPVMPETRMYVFKDNQFGIKTRFAGTMDILLTYQDPNDGIWKLVCDDWKTNKTLVNEFSRSNSKRMLSPFNDMYEEPMGHYTIQLSAYTVMLRQLGYIVADRNLVWLKDDSNFERIHIDDRSSEFLNF